MNEADGGLDALRILHGSDISPFATGWYETPNGYLYYMALVLRLLGANWLGLKWASLIPAILTIPAVYLLGRLVLGPRPALLAMVLMAGSRWHLTMSRWGWNETAPPLLELLGCYFLLRGLRDRKACDFALGGLLSGLTLYTYLSSRLVLAAILLFLGYRLIADRTGLRNAIRQSGAGVLIFLLAILIAVAPLAVTYATDQFTFTHRVAELSIFRQVSQDASIQPLLQNLLDMLRFFHQVGDFRGKHNLPGMPMLDPITGLFFAIGLAYANLETRGACTPIVSFFVGRRFGWQLS